MSDEKKIYCGSGKKEKEWARKISVCLSDILEEHTFEYNGKTYVKLNVVDKKEVDQFGKDIFLTVDTWKPDSSKSSQSSQPPPAVRKGQYEDSPKEPAQDDDLPF